MFLVKPQTIKKCEYCGKETREVVEELVQSNSDKFIIIACNNCHKKHLENEQFIKEYEKRIKEEEQKEQEKHRDKISENLELLIKQGKHNNQKGANKNA